MIATLSICYRSAFRCIVSLIAISLLAACGRADSTQAPVAAAQEKRAACPLPNSYVIGKLDKNDEELFSASEAGDVHRVEQSITAGANVNTTGHLKRTPLFGAAFCDRPEVARILIEKGSQVNVSDSSGMSPLHAAIIVGSPGTVKVLIAGGADLNIRDTAGRTPLHVAAATDQVSMVELLLQRGANPLARDKNGITAASLASENGHAKLGATIRNWKKKETTARQK
ncbi:MAG: ankyrin repeat domain-containing protein [Sulfuritalea sp.]|jgi:hypothetical protein|nr:ankyrin repeat domain-containing protein [Sulfuritalea sp.]